jgi:hypothetical protein
LSFKLRKKDPTTVSGGDPLAGTRRAAGPSRHYTRNHITLDLKPDQEAVNLARSEANNYRYLLQDAAREINPNSRTAACMRTRIAPQVEIWQKNGKSHLKGLHTCGSVWACPVCSSKVSEHRRADVVQAIQWAKDHNIKVYMLTLTVPHYSSQSVAEVTEKFKAGRVLMKHRKQWLAFEAQSDLIGSIQTTEVNYGNNGWHVHSHELLFFSDCGCAPESFDLSDYWGKAVKRVGLGETNEHGVHLEPVQSAADYMTKWGAAEEITLSRVKKSQYGGINPWGLLQVYADSKNETIAELFKDYVSAFKGKRQHVWSRGLRDLVGLNDELTDEQIAKGIDEGSQRLMVLGKDEWTLILKYKARARLINFANESGEEGVIQLLTELIEREGKGNAGDHDT